MKIYGFVAPPLERLGRLGRNIEWVLLNQQLQTFKPEVIMEILKNTEHKEGKVAKAIEEQTAKIPSDMFLWASLGSMAISLGLKIAGKKANALFVGQWAAPFMLLGIYNKLIKLEGSEKDKQ